MRRAVTTIGFLVALISLAVGASASGHDYPAKRKTLLEALKACATKPYPEEQECTYVVAEQLMELCRKGDLSLLRPLFDVSEKADGAFSESLGPFYSDMLNDHPRRFLKSLSAYPESKQRAVCWLAGAEDGSGMAEDRFRSVRKSLKRTSDTSLRRVARNCLSGIETAYRQTR